MKADIFSNYTPTGSLILRYPGIATAREGVARRIAVQVKKDWFLCYTQTKNQDLLKDHYLGYLNTTDAINWVRFAEKSGCSPSYEDS